MTESKLTAQIILDNWLDEKYQKALNKLELDTFSKEDMIILILKEHSEYILKLEQEIKNLK